MNSVKAEVAKAAATPTQTRIYNPSSVVESASLTPHTGTLKLFAEAQLNASGALDCETLFQTPVDGIASRIHEEAKAEDFKTSPKMAAVSKGTAAFASRLIDAPRIPDSLESDLSFASSLTLPVQRPSLRPRERKARSSKAPPLSRCTLAAEERKFTTPPSRCLPLVDQELLRRLEVTSNRTDVTSVEVNLNLLIDSAVFLPDIPHAQVGNGGSGPLHTARPSPRLASACRRLKKRPMTTSPLEAPLMLP